MDIKLRVAVIGFVVAMMHTGLICMATPTAKSNHKKSGIVDVAPVAVLGTNKALSVSKNKSLENKSAPVNHQSKSKAVSDKRKVLNRAHDSVAAPASMQDRLRAAYISLKKNMAIHYKTVGLACATVAGLGYWLSNKKSEHGDGTDTSKGNKGGSGKNKSGSNIKSPAKLVVVDAKTRKIQNQKLYDAFYKKDVPAMKAAIKAGAYPDLKLNPDEAARMGVEIQAVSKSNVQDRQAHSGRLEDSQDSDDEYNAPESEDSEKVIQYSKDTQTTILGGLIHELLTYQEMLFIEADAIPEEQRAQYDAAVHTIKEYKELIALLVDGGADMYGATMIDNQQLPLFGLAIILQDKEIVQMFLDKEKEVAPDEASRLLALKIQIPANSCNDQERVMTLLEWVALGLKGHSHCDAQERQRQQEIGALLLNARAKTLGDNVSDGEAFEAVSIGCQETVEKFLANGGNVNARDEDGCSLLVRAIQSRSQSLVEFLIQKGAAVDVKDEQGQTTLMHAARSQEYAIVALLLQYESVKRQAQDTSSSNLNALEYALRDISYDTKDATHNIIKLLEPYALSVHDENVLSKACEFDSIARLLVKQKNGTIDLRVYKKIKEDVLGPYHATVGMLQLLFDNDTVAGADGLGQPFYDNLLSTFEQKCWMHDGVASAMLQHDKKIAAGKPSLRNAISSKGTPAYIWLLAYSKSRYAIKGCVSRESKLDMIATWPELAAKKDADGKTVLMHMVCKKEDYSYLSEEDILVIDALLMHDAAVHAVDNAGKTALSYLIEANYGVNNEKVIIQKLIEHGADINVLHGEKSALAMMCERSSFYFADSLEYLLKSDQIITQETYNNVWQCMVRKHCEQRKLGYQYRFNNVSKELFACFIEHDKRMIAGHAHDQRKIALFANSTILIDGEQLTPLSVAIELYYSDVVKSIVQVLVDSGVEATSAAYYHKGRDSSVSLLEKLALSGYCTEDAKSHLLKERTNKELEEYKQIIDALLKHPAETDEYKNMHKAIQVIDGCIGTLKRDALRHAEQQLQDSETEISSSNACSGKGEAERQGGLEPVLLQIGLTNKQPDNRGAYSVSEEGEVFA